MLRRVALILLLVAVGSAVAVVSAVGSKVKQAAAAVHSPKPTAFLDGPGNDMQLLAASVTPATPPGPKTTYTVAPGDTLSSIAQRAGLGADNWQGIYEANRQIIGDNPSMIALGQTLEIPGASSVAPALASAPVQSPAAGDGDQDADDGATPPVAPHASAPVVPHASTPSAVTSGGGTGTANSSGWACIRSHESGNNYSSSGGGAYQFTDGTWHSLGYSGSAQNYSPAVQDAAAQKLYSQRGWQPWTTAGMCGL